MTRLIRTAAILAITLAISCEDQSSAIRAPANLEVVSGQDQSAAERTELAAPLVVRVLDSSGSPVNGALVNFRIISGGGSMFAGASLTNAQGTAQDRWTIGLATADSQVAEARAIDNTTGAAIVYARFKATATEVIVPALGVIGGEWETCAVSQAHKGFCWGYNPYGGLGDGTTTDRTTPTAILGNILFASINTGWRFSCGLAMDSTAYCWGHNDKGQFGNGTTADSRDPKPITARKFLRVDPSFYDYACGLGTDSLAYCWGAGYGNTPSSMGGRKFALLAAGDVICGVTPAGAAWCWNAGSSTPVAVSGSVAFTTLVSGGGHMCGLNAAGQAYCWGSNGNGQLGINASGSATAPTAVYGGLTFKSIGVGRYHTCAVASDDKPYCWGGNQNGQVGDGSNTDRFGPAPVQGGLTFVAVSGGVDHSCGIEKTRMVIYCWGGNRFGGLGDGTQINRPAPVVTRPLR